MGLSTKKIAEHDTANFSDCVNTGYTYTLYADGHLSAQYHSRWQGSRDGQRWVTDAGYVDTDEVSDDEALAAYVANANLAPSDPDSSEWRVTRAGWLVQ